MVWCHLLLSFFKTVFLGSIKLVALIINKDNFSRSQYIDGLIVANIQKFLFM